MKNLIMKTITVIAVMSMFLGLIHADCDSMVPPVTIAISGLWLIIFYYANTRRKPK